MGARYGYELFFITYKNLISWDPFPFKNELLEHLAIVRGLHELGNEKTI